MIAAQRPGQVQSAGMLMFIDSDGGVVLEVRMIFDYQNHAGFKDTLFIAEWPDGNTSVNLQVPVVIGDNVGDKDIGVSLNGIDGTLDWSLNERRLGRNHQGRCCDGCLDRPDRPCCPLPQIRRVR